MDLLWMVLLVVLVSAEAQNLTEVKEMLGKDITLNCSIRNTEVHWFMEIHNQLKVCIGRTYHDDVPSFCSDDFKSKYFMMDSILVIKNMTSGDRRFYFCGRKISGDVRFVDTFLLVSDVPDVPDVPPSPSDCRTQNQLVLVYRSALVVTVLLIMGLVCLSSYLKSKERTRQVDEPPDVI